MIFFIKKIIFILNMILVCFFSILILKKISNNLEILQFQKKNTPIYSNLNEKLLKILTFGHKNLYDDYLLFWMIDKVTSQKNIEIESQIQTVISLKPKIESIYMISCFYFAFLKHKTGSCEPIANIANQVLPNSWRTIVIQAYIDGFLNHQYLKSSYYYKIASQKKNAPIFLKSLSKRLQSGKFFIPKNLIKIPGIDILNKIFKKEN